MSNDLQKFTPQSAVAPTRSARRRRGTRRTVFGSVVLAGAIGLFVSPLGAQQVAPADAAAAAAAAKPPGG